MRHRKVLRAFRWFCSALAGAMLVSAGPVWSAEPDPVPNWALSKIRYQRWANTVSFTGMPAMPGFPGGAAMPGIPGMSMMPSLTEERAYCMDRDRVAECSLDKPGSPCKVTVISRTGLTQRARMDCPDMKTTADFVWAPDGLSWEVEFKPEDMPNMPPGMTMKVKSRYLGPCTEREVLR